MRRMLKKCLLGGTGGAPAASNLTIDITVNNATPIQYGNVQLTVTVLNNDPDQTSTGVTALIELPAGLTFVSKNPEVGTYNEGTGVWDIGTLLPSSDATLGIAVTVTTTSLVTVDADITAASPDNPPASDSVGVTGQAIFTLGYWHAQYSNPPSALNDGDPVNEWADLSAAANSLGVGSAAPIFDITTGVNSVDEWDTETANLQFSAPLSLTGAFTFFWLVDGHTGGVDVHAMAFQDAVEDVGGMYFNSGDGAVFATDNIGAEAGGTADIPDIATKCLIAFWRTAGNVVKVAATGMPTVTLGTAAGTLTAALLGGTPTNGVYETRKVIAAGCVGADVSAQLPAIAAALGTTLTL